MADLKSNMISKFKSFLNIGPDATLEDIEVMQNEMDEATTAFINDMKNRKPNN